MPHQGRGERDDLYQEMLLQLWRAADSFGGRSSTGTWVYRVALNTALSYRRKAGTRQAITSGGAVDPEKIRGGVGERDELRILEEFTATLGDVDRALLMLYLEDLSYREMADILGLTESHVGVRITHMKKRFSATYIGADMELDRFKDAWWEQPLIGAAARPTEDVLRALKEQVDRLEWQIRRRDWTETAAGLFVMVACGYIGGTTSSALVRVGAVVVLLGCLEVMLRLRLTRRRHPIDPQASTRAFCDNQIRRLDAQTHLLRTVGWWYLAPLLGGALLLTAGLPGALPGKILAAALNVAVGVWIYVINRRAVQTLLPMRNERAQLAGELAIGTAPSTKGSRSCSDSPLA